MFHYITAPAIVFMFAIANLTRAFMAVNPLVCPISVDSIYVCLSKSNQSIYSCPVPCNVTNYQA